MASTVNRLTDKKLRSLLGVRTEKLSKLSDGSGLMIKITKAGSISWLFKYRMGGRSTEATLITLGKYPDLTLTKAQELREQCRQWLAGGRDPQRMLKLKRESTLKPVYAVSTTQMMQNLARLCVRLATFRLRQGREATPKTAIESKLRLVIFPHRFLDMTDSICHP